MDQILMSYQLFFCFCSRIKSAVLLLPHLPGNAESMRTPVTFYCISDPMIPLTSYGYLDLSTNGDTSTAQKIQ